MSRKFNTIADINDMKETWKLTVRITSVSYVHNPPKPEYIEMILMDAKGDKIEAVVKSYDLAKWKSKLKEDSTYILQNFEVQINDGHYRKYDHPFKLIFMKGTTPKEQDLPEIPKDVYCFKKFEDILNGNLCSDFLVDVIGELYELGRPQADTKKKKVVFTMRDLSGNILSCTLWDEYASKFQSFHQSHKIGPMVIILTLAKIKEPEGNYPISIQNSYGSKLLINENIPEIQEYKNSLDSNQIPESFSQRLSQMSSCSQVSSQDKFLHKADVMSLSKVNGLMQECICVTIGTIVKVFASNGWSYEGCSKCNKKFVSPNASFTCTCGKYNEQYVPRYRLEIQVCHKKDTAKFVMWNNECCEIIRKPANDLKKLMIADGELDPMAFPESIDDILGLTLAFKIKVHRGSNRPSVLMLSQDAQLIGSLLNQISPDEETCTLDKEKSVCSVVKEDVLYDTSLSATADHDPDLLGCLTPAKRISPDMQFDDMPTQDLASTQLSSTKVAKHIKKE